MAEKKQGKRRVSRAYVSAPNGWRAVYEEDGQLVEKPVACFEIAVVGGEEEAYPLISFAGRVRVAADGDYRGMLGPGQTLDQIQADELCIDAARIRQATRATPDAAGSR